MLPSLAPTGQTKLAQASSSSNAALGHAPKMICPLPQSDCAKAEEMQVWMG